MLLNHYHHRLPAAFDLHQVRERAMARGNLWDNVPGLFFKAFLIREAGKRGAAANSYSSLYLWRDAVKLRDFLTDGRFSVVTDSFGRPAVNTGLVLDARKGPGENAKVLTLEEVPVPLDANIAAFAANEKERNFADATAKGTIAAVAALNPTAWTATRIRLMSEPPTGGSLATIFDIAYLAQPELDSLPDAAS